MIPMECPTCGRQGEVPLDRLNSKLTCKKCGTVFHMDATGHVVLGDPAAAALKMRSEAEIRRKEKDIDLRPSALLKAVPKGVWYTAAILTVLLGGGLVARRVVGSMGVPPDLAGRATYIGERFVDLRLDEIKELAKPDTLDDVQAWYDKVRPTLNYKGPRDERAEVDVYSYVLREQGDRGQTLTNLRVAAPEPVSPGDTAPKDEIILLMHWTKADGQWFIDGRQTLVEANKPPRRRATTGVRRGDGM